MSCLQNQFTSDTNVLFDFLNTLYQSIPLCFDLLCYWGELKQLSTYWRKAFLLTNKSLSQVSSLYNECIFTVELINIAWKGYICLTVIPSLMTTYNYRHVGIDNIRFGTTICWYMYLYQHQLWSPHFKLLLYYCEEDFNYKFLINNNNKHYHCH